MDDTPPFEINEEALKIGIEVARLHDMALVSELQVMRKQYLAEEMSTDNDAALIGQVSSREYQFESDGRISLQSKEKLNRSPDEADALAMTFAAPQGGVKIWV